ncbi:MAG TPA: glycoside hydrolase family 78 protein [Puia sp.]|jgi:alpha-L-rhamnosidase
MRTILSLCLLQLTSLFAAAQIVVNDCSVEYLSNPVGIDTREPRLSWIIGSKEKEIRQTAYQVFVASTPERAKETTADIWNSGKISSDNSVLIAYTGKPLLSGRRYYWRVRVWDQKGDSAITSEPVYWEMGLLEKGDWKGQWLSAPKVYDWQQFVAGRKLAIKTGKEEDPDPAPEFRKSFSFAKEIAQARLYISGVGYNIPYLNGQRIGDHALDAAFTRYDKTVLYSTYDVTGALHKGENVLGVVLGNGWYNMLSKDVWGFDHAPWRNAPAVLAQLEIVFRDGTREIVATDGSWKVAPGPVLFNSIRQGEWYDARKETPGWNTVGFNDTKWFQPVVVNGPAGELRAQMIQPVKITDTVVAKTITEPKPGIYVIDLGRNIAGFAELRIHAPAGTEITLKYSERLSGDGGVDQRDVAQHIEGGLVETDKYICKGEGLETWHSSFAYYGFQYIEITGLPARPDQATITGMIVHTAFEPAGSFQCSNELFNKIQRNALVSYQSNFMGYPTDCPQREKNGWTGDAHLAAEMGLYNFKSQNGYTKWLGDIADEQRPTGELSAIVPSSGWGYFWGNGPAWDNAMVLIPWYLYKYNGDRRILQQLYPHIRQYVDYLGSKSTDDIVKIGLGDWAPAKTRTPEEITSTAYYYVDAVIVSKIAGLFGNAEDQKKYAGLATRIKAAFNRHYYRGNGIYDQGTQTGLSCALYQGLTDEHKDETVNALVEAIRKNDDHLDCGILGTKYLLHALSDNGRSDVAYKIVNQHSFPSWGNWIDQGATTLWEQWNGTESRNHIMFGDVSAWFYENLAGIQPDADQPGFKRILFQPYFSPDLTWVKATHQTMYGEISAAWNRQGDHIYYKITIPANTTGEVILPAKKLVLGSGSYTIKVK